MRGILRLTKDDSVTDFDYSTLTSYHYEEQADRSILFVVTTIDRQRHKFENDKNLHISFIEEAGNDEISD